MSSRSWTRRAPRAFTRLRGSLKAAQRDLVCAAGTRSESAAKLAIENGLSRVYNPSGGTRGWVRAGLLLVRD